MKVGVEIVGRPWIVSCPSRRPALANSVCLSTKLIVSSGRVDAFSDAMLSDHYSSARRCWDLKGSSSGQAQKERAGTRPLQLLGCQCIEIDG